jgi:hypothetical protein
MFRMETDAGMVFGGRFWPVQHSPAKKAKEDKHLEPLTLQTGRCFACLFPETGGLQCPLMIRL